MLSVSQEMLDDAAAIEDMNIAATAALLRTVKSSTLSPWCFCRSHRRLLVDFFKP